MGQCRNGHEYNEANTYIYPKTGRRMCRVCHRDTERKRINSSEDLTKKNRERSRQWATDNPERYLAYRRQRSKKIKDWVAAQKIVCKLCPETHPACLDFHHRDGTRKEFNIGVANGTVSLKRIMKEVAKCDILCANCHRKLHAAEKAALKETV